MRSTLFLTLTAILMALLLDDRSAGPPAAPADPPRLEARMATDAASRLRGAAPDPGLPARTPGPTPGGDRPARPPFLEVRGRTVAGRPLYTSLAGPLGTRGGPCMVRFVDGTPCLLDPGRGWLSFDGSRWVPAGETVRARLPEPAEGPGQVPRIERVDRRGGVSR